MNRMKKNKIEEKLYLNGDREALRSEEKGLRKITFKRWSAVHDRGYDMINNCLLGEKEAPVYLPSPSRQKRDTGCS